MLTVVMLVYNALPFLDAAIESIAAQTLTDFRLCIYDDCSTDGSYETALDWARRDDRIAVTRGVQRLGPRASSQAAATLADSELVARMDADDIAAPDRLARQIAVLQDRSEVVLVGTACEFIDRHGRVVRRAHRGATSSRHAPFPHSSIMYRRAAFEAAGGYRAETDYFEDHDLYRRMSRQGAQLVINQPLIKMRFAGQNARLRDGAERVLERIDLLYRSADAPTTRRRLSPMAFYSVAVLAVLAPQRPRLLALLLRRQSFSQPLRAGVVLSFVALAEVSPRAARAVGGLISSVRGRRGQRPADGVYEWHTSA